MTSFRKHPLQALIGASALALAACGGSDSSSDNSADGNSGRLSVAVTDAPIDAANHVFVEFSGVSIKPADGDVIELTLEENANIDLLSLQGSLSEALVTDEEVPAGEYEWVRLHVNAEHDGVLDSYIELDTGNQLELRVPSGSQTGLKLVSGFTVAAGGNTNITIDFDLRKSVVLPGGQAGAMLKPALRLIDNTVVGTVAGSVDAEVLTDQCADPANEYGAVYVYSGADATVTDVSGADTDPLTTALLAQVDGGYEYEVGFLEAGDYTLAYTCDAASDQPETVDELTFIGSSNATVEADMTTEVNFTVDQLPTDDETASQEDTAAQ